MTSHTVRIVERVVAYACILFVVLFLLAMAALMGLGAYLSHIGFTVD